MTTCNALVLNEPGENRLKIEKISLPVVHHDHALIKIKAAALNHRDQWIREGKYAHIKSPCVLGSDACGIVQKVGDFALTHLEGKEVIINPNVDWGQNEKVQSLDYGILGMPSNGTFSEYLVVPIDRIHRKPSHLTSAEAASLPLAGLTAYRALFTQGDLKKKENVLITGSGGGVAQFAILFATAIGANVWVTSSKPESIEKAIKSGAKGGVNYKEENWSKQLLEKVESFDLIIDGAGGKGWNEFFKLANFGGRIVQYGATAGRPDGINIQALFWKQLTIQGSTMGSDDDFEKMINLVEKYKIKPTVDSIRPFKDIISGFDDMASGKQTGKIVFEF
ncbi:MAG: zinc-binding alcohol dehydrogenase/oxidoreductase [Sphingobacteriales bacterium]|jgi:zinc-binding alcohol dehydrogenase/oxidoreductase